MTTILIVHGTGGRAAQYSAEEGRVFLRICERFRDNPAVTIETCPWGEAAGARPQYNWASLHPPTSRISYLRQKQEAVAEPLHRMIGDILLYQTRGDAIRAYVRRRILESAGAGPIVVAGHSLGGVAAVDVLAAEDLRAQVRLLVTLGSQAPLLYEVGALHSVATGRPLPLHVPPWLNIYDSADFLSYVGEGVFGPERITDLEISNGRVPWRAHNAYWDNPQVWAAIFARVPGD